MAAAAPTTPGEDVSSIRRKRHHDADEGGECDRKADDRTAAPTRQAAYVACRYHRSNNPARLCGKPEPDPRAQRSKPPLSAELYSTAASGSATGTSPATWGHLWRQPHWSPA